MRVVTNKTSRNYCRVVQVVLRTRSVKDACLRLRMKECESRLLKRTIEYSSTSDRKHLMVYKGGKVDNNMKEVDGSEREIEIKRQ